MSAKLKMVKTCLVCGNVFHPFNKDQSYCNRACYNKVRGKKTNTQVTKKCTVCGSKYKVKGYRAKSAKYCSKECWSNRSPASTFKCPYCNKQFKSHDRNAIYCSRQCRGRDKTGKDAPRWIDGKSLKRQRARDSRELKEWREAVYKRDNYTCQHCGANGCHFHAHHIKGYAKHKELRFDIDNGITLCVPCHEKVHGRRLRSPSKYPKKCQDCDAKISGQSYYCRSCAIKRSWLKRRQKPDAE